MELPGALPIRPALWAENGKLSSLWYSKNVPSRSMLEQTARQLHAKISLVLRSTVIFWLTCRDKEAMKTAIGAFCDWWRAFELNYNSTGEGTPKKHIHTLSLTHIHVIIHLSTTSKARLCVYDQAAHTCWGRHQAMKRTCGHFEYKCQLTGWQQTVDCSGRLMACEMAPQLDTKSDRWSFPSVGQ